MSVCWPSEPAARRRAGPGRASRAGGHRLRALAAAAALAALASLAPAECPAAGPAAQDSAGFVQRVTVSGRGIVVQRAGRTDTVVDRIGARVRERAGDDVGRRIERRVRERLDDGGGLVLVDEPGAAIVRIWSDAHVPAGEVVDGDVVVVFGSVTVEGTVKRDVVAVMGSVRLGPGARVEGDVVSVGGALEQAPGAIIQGESVQLGFVPFTWGLPAVSVLLFAIAAGWLLSMFVGWIFTLLFPTGMLRVATVVEQRPAAAFFLGVLSVPMFLLALVLLCITVIGIPIGLLLPMVYMVMGYAGQLAATVVLGARLTRRSLAGGLMLPLLVGTLFVAALLALGAGFMTAGGFARTVALFLSLSGLLLLLGLGALGTGALLLSRFGTRPPEVVWLAPAPAPVAAGPMPGSPPPAPG